MAICFVNVREISAQPEIRPSLSGYHNEDGAGSWYNVMKCEVQTVGSYAGGDNSPFWFSSNRQGVVLDKLSGGYGRAGLEGVISHSSGLFLDYGIDGVCGGGLQSKLFLQQLYANLGFRCLDISIGQKERWGELADKDLSSGSLTWSGNSRPIPQVRFEMPDFTRLPILGNWFSIKGHVAYGKYLDGEWSREFVKNSEKQRYTSNTLYHSKAAFIKVGDMDRFPLEGILGLEMYNQFGGTSYNIDMVDRDGNPVPPVYEFPSDMQAYIDAFLPFNKAGDQQRDNGNILGSWHLAFNTKINDWQYMLRYEHFYEDHSSMLGIEYKRNIDGIKKLKFYGFQNNWLDGLFALEVKAPKGMWFNKAVFEFLNTRSQSGPVCVIHNIASMPNVDGRDNMYQHYIFQSYSYFGNYMGTPLLVSPIYNTNGSLYPRSTRAMVFYLGIDGNVTERIGYRYKVSRSSHWGTYDTPLKRVEKITSQLLELSYNTPEDLKFILSVGLDRDSERTAGNDLYLIGNQSGIMLTMAKKWRAK